MKPITYIPSTQDDDALRRRALANVYEYLIELVEKSETIIPIANSTTQISSEQELETTVISSVESETEEIVEMEIARILKPAS